MQEYIGDLKQYLEVEYAKSGRSKCRKCKQKIDKDELRVGIHFDDQKFSTDNWFHLKCFEFKPRHRVLNLSNLQNHIEGIDQLDQNDYSFLMKTLKAEFKEFQDRKHKLKRKRSFDKQGRYDKSQQNIWHKNQLIELKKKQGKKYVKPSKRPILRHPLTRAQKQQNKRLLKHYEKFSVHELKNILERNGQVKIGNKQQLAARCAEGMQFGRIPPCPKCGGGRLRLDRDKGIYYCPGFMEDTDFVHCDGKFNFDDVQRTQWIE